MEERLILKELSRYPIGTYADIIYRNALLNAEREAFVYGPKRITFSEYNRRVNRVIHVLRSMGLKKGDGIGILAWNCLECTDVTGAAMKGGFICSPFNPRMQADELRYLVNYSEVRVLFVGPELVPVVNELRADFPKVERYIAVEEDAPGMESYDKLVAAADDGEAEVSLSEDDPFIIFYTSGTTGVPRGAVYSHYKKLEEARTKVFQVGFQPENKHVMILPLFHIGGWSHFWALFTAGACNIIMTQRSFDPAATLQTLADEKATDVHIVPTQLAIMLNVPNAESYDLSAVKRIWYAASPMPLELLRRGIAKFGPIFAQGYGQSESGPDITILGRQFHDVVDKSPEEQKVLTSSGQPCMWVHARIVDEAGNDVPPFAVGEIVVQSKSVMKEYWRKPEDTARTIVDGWLHTGDMGYYDERGFIYISDRKKDMIISGGENVYPREVEDVLYRHPAVFEAAVIGLPDDVWVEKVHAVVALKEGQTATEEEIINFCKSQLARYKAPRSVEFVDALPKSSQGKILKREIRDKYWQGKERKV